MRLFVDMHHWGLHKSFQFLFEKRLGLELYRPIGLEWFEKGYWQNAAIYNNHPDTINQFLQIRNSVPTKMGPRNEVIEENPDYYIIKDEQGNVNEKAMTYDQFMTNPPDVVIASYYGNIDCYKELADRVGAKFVAQYGNNWPTKWQIYDNLMASVAPNSIQVPDGKHAIFYHQEFDQETYKYREPNPDSKFMRSFVHCLMEHDMHKQDWTDFQELERLLPEYTFESYGISCREGTCIKQNKLADMMGASKFGIHFKNHGDGYGHVIHQWFSVGRPVIYKGSQYAPHLAGELLIDGITGFDLEKRGMQGIVDVVNNLSDQDYLLMCESVKKRFSETVNFEEEAKQIKQFMENLV